jgi:hypothetical protein
MIHIWVGRPECRENDHDKFPPDLNFNADDISTSQIFLEIPDNLTMLGVQTLQYEFIELETGKSRPSEIGKLRNAQKMQGNSKGVGFFFLEFVRQVMLQCLKNWALFWRCGDTSISGSSPFGTPASKPLNILFNLITTASDITHK